MSCNVMSQDTERSGKSTLLPGAHPPSLGPNGPVRHEVRSGKWEVGSGKWEKLIIRPFLVQSTLSGSFGPNFGFGALKENLVGDGFLRPVGGSGVLLWVAGGRGS